MHFVFQKIKLTKASYLVGILEGSELGQKQSRLKWLGIAGPTKPLCLFLKE